MYLKGDSNKHHHHQTDELQNAHPMQAPLSETQPNKHCRSCHSSPSSVVCLCPSVCSPEVTVSSLHPPRLCRLVVFSIKPTLLSKHHHQPHWKPPIEIGVRRKRKKLGRASCYKIVKWAHCSVTDRINNRRQRSKVGKPRNRGSESSK